MPKSSDERVWGQATDGCRLSMSAEGPAVQAGSPVLLSLVFWNDGQTTVRFPRASIWLEYDYTVTFEDGEPVALTSFGQEKQRSMREQGGTLLEFQPGSQTPATVQITRLYDLSRPGRYTIGAAKTVPNRAGNGFMKVVSNTIAVEVVE